MAKQHLTDRRVIDLCGVLDKDEDGLFTVTIESSKDDIEVYNIEKILEQMLGQVITLKSEIF